MARVERILEKNGKKLLINKFLSEEIREKDEQGNFKDDFVNIKKLSYSVKKKIDFISMNNFTGKSGKNLFSLLKKKNLSIESMNIMNPADKAELMIEMMSSDDTNILQKMTLELAELIIDNGIDENDHSFIGEENKPVKLNYKFLESLGNVQLIEFIIDEIKTFSKGFVLGE